MTDTEISKALALAIGWKPENVLPNEVNQVVMQCWIYVGYEWRVFDYRDPAVIWPIAERYNCFQKRMITEWSVIRFDMQTYGDTAAKAVALAVIGIHAPK